MDVPTCASPPGWDRYVPTNFEWVVVLAGTEVAAASNQIAQAETRKGKQLIILIALSIIERETNPCKRRSRHRSTTRIVFAEEQILFNS